MSVRRWRRRRKDGSVHARWVVDVLHTGPDGKKIRHRAFPKVQTKAGALQLERELRWSLAGGGRIADAPTVEAQKGETLTLSEFWPEYFSVHVLPNNKPSEREAKRSIFRNHLEPIFGRAPLASIQNREIEGYKAHKFSELGYSPKTVNNHLAVLRGVLNTARRWRLLPNIPTYRELRCPQSTVRFLSSEEAGRLLHAADEPWRAMISLCLNTGLRIGELIALQWSDIDLTARRLTVRRSIWRHVVGTPKSGRNREVPLNTDALAALSTVAKVHPEWVFVRADCTHMTNASARRPLARALKLAGLPALQWHALRHTFASHLVSGGVPLRTVQYLLGHANYATTERYAHLAPRATLEAVDGLSFTAR